MKARRPGLLLLLGLFLLHSLAAAKTDDAFLDQSIPFAPEPNSYVYLDQVRALPPLLGKRAIFPPGLIEYLSANKLMMHCRSGYMADPDGKITLRHFLDQYRHVVDLSWKYEPDRDALVFDFSWHVPVPPSIDLKSLVQVVATTKPLSSKIKLEKATSIDDPWETAFRTLLSHPDNFPHAWKVRLNDFCFGGDFGFWTFSNFVQENVHTSLLKDASGQGHLLVLHQIQGMINKYPHPIFCYLMDANGKWEDGGVLEPSYGIYPLPTIRDESGHRRVAIETVQTFPTTSNVSMTFNGWLPSFSHSGAFNWGFPSFSWDATDWRLTLTFIARSRTTYAFYLSVDHGKLVATQAKDGMPISPTNSDVGQKLLEHLGD